MSEAVARGSLVLSLDATQLNRGLNKAAKDTKQKTNELAKNFKESAGEFGKDLTGGDKGLLGMGAKAGVIGAVVAGVAMLGKSLWDAYGPLNDVNKEIERGAEIHQAWRDKVAESAAVNREWINSLSDIQGTAAGMAQIAHHADQMAGSVGEMEAELKRLKAQQEDNKSWGNWDSWSQWLTGTHEATQQGITAKVDATKASVEQLKKQADEVAKLQARLKNPLTNPEAVASVRQFVQGMEDATRVLQGASSEMLQIEALQRKFNLNAEQVGQMRAAVAAKMAAESAKELAEATKSADDFIKELGDSVGLYGAVVEKSAEDAKLEELIKKGIDQDQIDRIRQLIALKKMANQTYTPLQALQKGTAAEISFQNKGRFEAERDRQVKAQLDEMKRAGKILADIRDGVGKLDKDAPEI